jgi:endonuclease/exonuclease/phosphatase family metal-dependent hydrolase
MKINDTDAVAAELLQTGLRGKGEKKLAALDDGVLRALVDAIGAGGSIDENTKVEEMVKILMKKKRQDAKTKQKPKQEPTEEPKDVSVKIPNEHPKDYEFRPISPPPRPYTPAPPVWVAPFAVVKKETSSLLTRTSIWKPRYSLKICAFNALKLRLDREDLKDDWKELIADFAVDMDVIVLSEVRASNVLFQRRAVGLLERLNLAGERAWSLAASESSGPGIPELHVILCKSPVVVLRHQTLSTIGSIHMDHSPFSALLEDSRPGGGRFVVTSVHLPPESRSRERDVQIVRLLEMYGKTGEASIRLDTPFTTKGAKDAKTSFVAHILAGDWNSYMGDPRYDVRKQGFEVLFGDNTKTTAGKKSFDNFLLSEDTRNHYTISAKVLELLVHQNSRKSIIGLSDHSPIFLELERAL